MSDFDYIKTLVTKFGFKVGKADSDDYPVYHKEFGKFYDMYLMNLDGDMPQWFDAKCKLLFNRKDNPDSFAIYFDCIPGCLRWLRITEELVESIEVYHKTMDLIKIRP